ERARADVESFGQTFADLGRGRPGVRHHEDIVDVDVGLIEDLLHSVEECRCLAASRSATETRDVRIGGHCPQHELVHYKRRGSSTGALGERHTHSRRDRTPAMFTGIVETTGTVGAVRDEEGGRRLEIETDLEDLSHGASIAVDGACLTAEAV